MKRLASLILLVILCYNTVGYYFVFNYKVLQVKSEVKRLIKQSVPEEELVLIRLTAENVREFKWIHSREFRYRGSMYDIVKIRAVSDRITEYYCIEDVKEAGLFSHLNSLVSDIMSGNGQTARIKSLFSAFLAGLFPPPYHEHGLIRNVEPLAFFTASDLYAYMHTHLILQPPKF